MEFLLIIALGFVGGIIFRKIKVPAGMMLGAMVTTGILVAGFHVAPAPSITKYVAQAAGGMYIGCSSSKEEIMQLRTFAKPALWLTASLALINIVMGLLLWFMGYSDLLTCLMCAVPGGISDVTLIAADMGADAARVLVIHLCRLICGIGLFPMMVNKTTPPMPEEYNEKEQAQRATMPSHNYIRFTTLAALCGVGAYAGVSLGVPAGCLLGAMLVAFTVRFAGFQVVFPTRMRLAAQLVSGMYVGGLLDPSLFHNWQTTVGAVLVSAAILILNAYLFSYLMERFVDIPRREGMLMLTPAGVSDMALISADIGVHSSRLILMQLYRFIIASALFPQICYAVVQWLGY